MANRREQRTAEIARQIAAVIPEIIIQLQGRLNPPPPTPDPNPVTSEEPKPPRCSYKHFNSCHPTKFTGADGVTGLLQWFESMENTFLHSECPDDLKALYATGSFHKRALTWWNGEKRVLGEAATTALTWDQLKERMKKEFCPRSEVKKLEREFWDLEQESGENQAYNNRFHELSLLVPHLVTPVSLAIEKYTDGLPIQIRDAVVSSDPATLEAAIRLAATLNENQVKAGNLTRKGSKKTEKGPTNEPAKEEPKTGSSSSSFRNRKRKAPNQAYAVTHNALVQATPIQATPIQQVNPMAQAPRRAYTGTHPLCATCNYHHLPTQQCRLCTNCNRYGHFANICRAPKVQANQPIVPLLTAPRVRACFQCGDPNHFIQDCPQRARQVYANPGNQANPAARGRAFVVNTTEAQANNDVVNG